MVCKPHTVLPASWQWRHPSMRTGPDVHTTVGSGHSGSSGYSLPVEAASLGSIQASVRTAARLLSLSRCTGTRMVTLGVERPEGVTLGVEQPEGVTLGVEYF